MSGDYPDSKELKVIQNWKIEKKEDIKALIEFIHDIWHWGDTYFKVTGKNVLRVEMHTGGWSGNEDIIFALRHNIFYGAFFQKELAGGHYYFTVNLKGWK